MNWTEEFWIKLYRRASPSFLSMSWQARGIFRLVITEVDPLGNLELGKMGLRALAVAIRAPWSEVQGYVQECLDDGCIVVSEDGRILTIPNFVEAQDAAQSDRARSRARRERQRAFERTEHTDSYSVTERDKSITERDSSVTAGHDASRAVTFGHAASRSEEIRSEEKRSEKREGSSGCDKVPSLPGMTQPPAPRDTSRSDAEEVLTYWRERHAPKAKSSAQREAKVKARLREGFSVADLKAAVDGVFSDPWLMGEDSKSRPGGYRDAVTIFRDAPQVERLMALAGTIERDDDSLYEDVPHEEDPPGTVYQREPPPEFLAALDMLVKGQSL